MAKKKNNQSEQSETPKRKKYAFSGYISPDLGEAIDRYMASFEYPPTQTAVIERALRKLLIEAGFLEEPE